MAVLEFTLVSRTSIAMYNWLGFIVAGKNILPNGLKSK